MRALVRCTTARIAGLDNDALMKSFCMSCNTKAVLDRPIGGNGAPFIFLPPGFLRVSSQTDSPSSPTRLALVAAAALNPQFSLDFP